MNWHFDAGCTSAEYGTPRRSLVSWDVFEMIKASGQTKRRMSDSFESFQRCLSVSLFPGIWGDSVRSFNSSAASAGSSLLGKDMRRSLTMLYNTHGGCHLIYMQYAKACATKSSMIKWCILLAAVDIKNIRYKSTAATAAVCIVSALFMIGGSYSGCHIECNSISLHIQMSNIINLPLLGISHRQGWIRRDLIWPLLPAQSPSRLHK